MASLPVVAVVATHGEERLGLLLNRSLPSVNKQSRPVDLVVVVSDNDPVSNFLEREDIESCFDGTSKDKVRFLQNERTSRMSGTGSWNTGILEALSTFGGDCWVAILDDDDEWHESHVETCLKSATSQECQWVVSGIVRMGKIGESKEPIPNHIPLAKDFFTTNPGVQGSNLFVRCETLLKAGLFDEKLSSTTDRDLCIRLSDILHGVDSSFASTGEYTVVHYADPFRPRVSKYGSPAKIQGLRAFYVKHAPRMTVDERESFKTRAKLVFGATEEDFASSAKAHSGLCFAAWSSKVSLPLNPGTLSFLPVLDKVGIMEANKKRDALFGVTTSDMNRVSYILDDLAAASGSINCDFNPFVVVFANGENELSSLITNELKVRNLRGFVLPLSSPTVVAILQECQGFTSSLERLPISLSRSVLQSFIFSLVGFLSSVEAVVIIDDDKRIPMHWSPFVSNKADILIGRDLRTPPNPSLFSLRTNLIDLMYNLDLHHSDSNIWSFCFAQNFRQSEVFDWYYDLSSSKFDHLEMPIYSELLANEICFSDDDYLRKLHRDLLLGTPLCRDVIPTEAGKTEQRGGCMVILKKDSESFAPLALEQHAPKISFSDGTVSTTRRSDTLWCKELAKTNRTIEVDQNLFVYHDNRFDKVSDSSSIRKSIVQEVIGGILCRDIVWRAKYKRERILGLKSWLYRTRGILQALRNRPYCRDGLIRCIISPLEDLLNLSSWESEVFSAIELAFDEVKEFTPKPADLSLVASISPSNLTKIREEFHKDRITKAKFVLSQSIGYNGTYVGLGSEGVCLRVDDKVFKVFDLVRDREMLPPEESLRFLNASYIDSDTPMIARKYYPGVTYRGGHSNAMIKLLRTWKSYGLCHTNLTPDNLIYDENTQTLTVVDIGRDVNGPQGFNDMCKRAYLCVQFGSYGGNSKLSKSLRNWMREDTSSPRFVGFDNFMKIVNGLVELNITARVHRMLDETDYCAIVGSFHNELNASAAQTISSNVDDKILINDIKHVLKKLKSNHGRVALVIEDPQCYRKIKTGRPLRFFNRHLSRLQVQFSFKIEQDEIVTIDEQSFQEYVAYHVYLLIPLGRIPSIPGCFLMIKSCPMEHETILSDVRRIVHSLEPTTSFKSILLVADTSKQDGFLRQYTSVDMHAYTTALDKIIEERLVDKLVLVDGKDAAQLFQVNNRWLGNSCASSHSLTGQQYASTMIGFDMIRNHPCFEPNDLVLQMDSDIIIKCNCDVIRQCASIFERDPSVVSFAFPIPSKGGAALQHLDKSGKPFRFEIRCSFLHLDRLVAMLPLRVPDVKVQSENYCINNGWWHTLDYNIQLNGMKSCRGDLCTSCFLHPPNEFKMSTTKRINLLIVSDAISQAMDTSVLWEKQLGFVNLKSTTLRWLQSRHESVVVAFILNEYTPYGMALHCFDSFLRQSKGKKLFDNCGIILFDNGLFNYEDDANKILGGGRKLFKSDHLSIFLSRQQLPTPKVHAAIKAMCQNPSSIIFLTRVTTRFDLVRSVCLLPKMALNVCIECGSYYDTSSCPCSGPDNPVVFSVTSLPIETSSFGGIGTSVMETTCYASDYFDEGGLKVQITALVKGNHRIKGAENVAVRIHSECLTGDVFYSKKCDCGEQKHKFMQLMEKEKNGVLVYIKGHEGRGAGLYSKIKAYKILDTESSKNHIDALLAVGCQSDIREYNAAVRFLKYTLEIKSLRLFSNNSHKFEAVKKLFGSQCRRQSMPTVPGEYNEKYLQEKVSLCGHDGLLE